MRLHCLSKPLAQLGNRRTIQQRLELLPARLRPLQLSRLGQAFALPGLQSRIEARRLIHWVTVTRLGFGESHGRGGGHDSIGGSTSELRRPCVLLLGDHSLVDPLLQHRPTARGRGLRRALLASRSVLLDEVIDRSLRVPTPDTSVQQDGSHARLKCHHGPVDVALLGRPPVQIGVLLPPGFDGLRELAQPLGVGWKAVPRAPCFSVGPHRRMR